MSSQPEVRSGSTLVLAVLASGQFLMTLDSSVMNVSMATVAQDVGTTITGIQTAITLYTLVMASLMITGGKVGTILGRRRAFGVGLVIYGIGSFTTGLAPNLAVLLVGWSLLEGIGAALIMPAIVSLVAANFAPERRSAAYGLVAAAGASAVAVGPLLGGAVTTFASWRYVFFGEVVLVVLILLVLRRIEDVPPHRVHLDLVGSALSVLGLGSVVYGVLRSSEWGWVRAEPGAPAVLGLSPVIWLLVAGSLVLYAFMRWQSALVSKGRGMDPGADAAVVSIPMLLMGLGLGALASQLGAITVSSVPDSQSAEVGGVQNTATNLGASLGTALIGSILIATLTTSVVAGIEDNSDIPPSVQQQATTELASGVPFLSTTQLRAGLDEAGVDPSTTEALVAVNADARLEGLRAAFAVTALLAIAALFGTGRLPRRSVGTPPP
ncbi:Major Facilitator Superfamily protein [Rhodococcus pyridinivorans]|uniref:MFS transporter n=1 Tax=Rhodococcus pyridinivorans TaxID=103816 RepID=UPI0007CD4EC9|nr:MFS transporter [Rhodococcus pyridinivorans]SED32208.1 Major Facilitator Superfamily protein [Rhodococcus pyridinivorans]